MENFEDLLPRHKHDHDRVEMIIWIGQWHQEY